MSHLSGWLPAVPDRPTGRVVEAMGRALRAAPGERWARWELPGLGVGLLAGPAPDAPGREALPAGSLADEARPAVLEGRHYLWMAGEVFAGPAAVEPRSAAESRTHAFRRRLLAALVDAGPEALLPRLDGEFQIVLWDAEEGRLSLLNDRFGSLPWYRAENPDGFAFAGGVRGALCAPGVSPAADREALREAVTFGGFRLTDRTNVEAVRMLPGACRAVAQGGRLCSLARTWRWPRDPEPSRPSRSADLLAEAHHLWSRAVGARLDGARSPGQTLSGGLDSRAILAEAAPRSPRWTAITYGIPGCDDALYAERAVRAAGGEWLFLPLYAPFPGEGESGAGWLEERTRHVQATDGLIELGDLMHLESLPLQAERLDLNLSGYIGDAVAGPTFTDVSGDEGVLLQLPYYGARIGLGWEEALDRVRKAVRDLEGAAPRYALFDTKIPQSTNRWTAALRPHVTVRRPFTDAGLFDFFQALPLALRREGRFYERFLRTAYPALFARIPNQKTGLPVLAPAWRHQAERARRYAGRRLRGALERLGLGAPSRRRAFTADAVHWREPAARETIRAAVLRPGSLACDIFGPGEVEAVLRDWEERAAAPAQLIGALYVYETYHRDLAAFLAERRANPFDHEP